MTELVRLEHLQKNYGSFCALQDVNLTVGEGVTGLLGPNGAGKSTLIKVMLGLVRLTAGKATVLGHDVVTESRLIREKVGFMPEDDCYMHGLSGIESVQMAACLSCLPPVEALRRGHEILDFCGMGQERYRNVETYSTGMRQKLRFAMAIVHSPQLLILDEPTSGLDPEEREAMLNRIRVLSKRFGMAIILCTHILPDVQVVCDSVAILAGGAVRLSSPLQDVLAPSEPAIFVQVDRDPHLLQAELQKLNQSCSEIEDKPNFVVLDGDIQELSEKLWQAAHAAGVGILKMSPALSSLEDVFIKAVMEDQHAHS
ncbi:MAG TPA: ABC transporter ATP-binding protein [Planctomycetaceae bacterium]|nr:ABC transporter ATP-binding protein [Planctomycetaceae bacterium]